MIINDEDVVIIGAGAAGIGAGLTLSRAGVPYIILEAQHRIGGRAHTDTQSLGHLWDRGCHWFHSADINPMRTLADRLKHPYGTEPGKWSDALHLGDRWASEAELQEAGAFIASGFERITKAGAAHEDVAVHDILIQDDAWSPLMRDWLALMSAHEPDQISALDYASHDDTDVNLAVSGGVGTLFELMARGLRIRTGSEVTHIRVNDGAVEVETNDDVLVRAGAAIVTVSTEVLRADSIAFDPVLPGSLTGALDDLTMGNGEKIALSFDGDPFGLPQTSYVSVWDRTNADARNVWFELMPFGRPLAIAHVGGTLARDLEAAGEDTMVDYAVDALRTAFGSDIASKVKQVATTNWSSDPHVRGAYSCARPGGAASRAVLREPVADRIFLAGEAASERFFATCHGAYLSGIDAAHEAAELVGHWRHDKDPCWLPVFGKAE